jgi:hypothetical protein
MSCSCRVVMEYLASIGAEHAAKMHLNPAAEWSKADSRAHMAEERVKLWPRLREHGSFWLLNMNGFYESVPAAALIAQLDADHVDFERELSDNGVIISPLLPKHSALEDSIVLQLVEVSHGRR